MYGIDVGVKLNSQEDWGKATDILEQWRDHSVSAGTGFGVRDMQFEYEDGKEANEVAKAIRTSLEAAGLVVEYLEVGRA